MIRTQLYLTEQEHKALRNIGPFLKKTQSELIRMAIDEFVVRHGFLGKKALLLEAAGSWKDSAFDLEEERLSWNRSF